MTTFLITVHLFELRKGGMDLTTSVDSVEEAIKLYPEFVKRYPNARVTLTTS